MHFNWLRYIFRYTEKESFSSAVNVLRNGLKILYPTKTDISELKFSKMTKKIEKTTVVQISAVFRTL